uniref:Uncharacterized protein n=1 Tax=Vitis vinifera TaxID=29760 RepID=A5AQK1_VITVI|nr:hypothetical protein VITISV_018335 [Vitis vinifera]
MTLLDLGASVNLHPYSIYKQLGLGELKATIITLSLVDRLIKVPRGVVKDVLVQVEKFYYLVDFVMLDTKPLKNGVNSVLIIFGIPFLATTNALINYRNGLMQLSFGNMTVEMNVFNLCKQSMDHDDVENEEACCGPRISVHALPLDGKLDFYLKNDFYLLENDLESPLIFILF